MGLPLIAEVGEERTLTEEFSLDDFKEVMTLLGYGSAVGSWTVTGIKKALGELSKTVAGIGTVLVVVSVSSTVASMILDALKAAGFKGVEATYTYRYDLLYGDPTTVPRWQVVDSDFSLI